MKKLLNINTVLISLVLLAGISGIWFLNHNKTNGATAIVDIMKNGNQERLEIDLSVDKVYKIDAHLPVTLEVKDGKISFINSQCPDKLCEAFGWISYDHDIASCLPAGVVVTIDAPAQ